MQTKLESSIYKLSSKTKFPISIRKLCLQTQFEHSIRKLNSNIKFANSIRKLILQTQFDKSVRKLNSKIQRANSIRQLNLQTQFANKIRKQQHTQIKQNNNTNTEHIAWFKHNRTQDNKQNKQKYNYKQIITTQHTHKITTTK